jgi:hypothetical protein
MMSVAQYQARVGPDGVLDLHLALGPDQANREVSVLIRASDPHPAAQMSQEEWEQFILETAGSIDEPTFVRHPQGEFERRENPFP